jgi:hypothetical protein
MIVYDLPGKPLGCHQVGKLLQTHIPEAAQPQRSPRTDKIIGAVDGGEFQIPMALTACTCIHI